MEVTSGVICLAILYIRENNGNHRDPHPEDVNKHLIDFANS